MVLDSEIHKKVILDSSNLRPSRAMYIDDGFDTKVIRLEDDQRSKYNHSSTLKSNARFP